MNNQASNLYTYIILVIVVFLVFVFPKYLKNSSSANSKKDNSATNKDKNTEKEEVKTGAEGQMAYRFGYTN